MTTLVEQVVSRLDAEVPGLKGRVEFVADLAALVETGALPQNEVAAYVVSLGFDDRGGEAAAGMHTQILDDAIGVILCVRSHGDAKARRAVPTVDALKDQTINVLAGWAPDDVIDVFHVTRGRLVSVTAGLVIYQIDFRLTDQLRIAT